MVYVWSLTEEKEKRTKKTVASERNANEKQQKGRQFTRSALAFPVNWEGICLLQSRKITARREHDIRSGIDFQGFLAHSDKQVLYSITPKAVLMVFPALRCSLIAFCRLVTSGRDSISAGILGT